MLEYILLSGCGYLVFGCRYWLPAKATDNRKPTTYNQTPSTYHYIFLFIDILFLNKITKQLDNSSSTPRYLPPFPGG